MKIIAAIGLSLLLVAGGSSAAPAETPRTDINPALLYYESFILEPQLSPADSEYWTTNDWNAWPFADRFVKLINSHHNGLKLWHQAAKQTVPCDWGIDLSPGPETLLPELSKCKQAAQVLRLHAVWELQQGNDSAAREDLLAALALGRNSAQDGTLIGVLVQIAIENIVISTVAENFQHFSPPTLRALADGFDAAPPRRTIRDCMAAEKFMSGNWLNARLQELQQAHPNDEAAVLEGARHLIENLGPENDTNYWQMLTNYAGGTVAGLVKMSLGSEAFADQMLPLLTLPHGEFEPQFQQFYDQVKQSGNFLFGDSLGAFPSSRRKEFTVQAELAMVQAAIEYKLHGEAGLKLIPDPLGNGPFVCERFVYQGVDRGFQLKSAYVPASTPAMKPWSPTTDGSYTNTPSGTPVTLIFVEKDGPRFNVLGAHAGEPVKP